MNKKLIISIIFALLSISLFAQTELFVVDKYAHTELDNYHRKWSDWSDWKDASAIVSMRYDKNSISFNSEDEYGYKLEVYKLKDYYGIKREDDGTISCLYSASYGTLFEANREDCFITLAQETNGNKYIYIQFRTRQFFIYIKEPRNMSDQGRVKYKYFFDGFKKDNSLLSR